MEGTKVQSKAMQNEWFLAIARPLYFRIMQSRYHLKGFRERNLILVRVVKFCILKGALLPWKFLEIFCLCAFQKKFSFNETVIPSD